MSEVHEGSTADPGVDFLTGELAEGYLPDASESPWLTDGEDDAESEKEKKDKKDEKEKKDKKDMEVEPQRSTTRRC